jgi:hypothetical protein
VRPLPFVVLLLASCVACAEAGEEEGGGGSADARRLDAPSSGSDAPGAVLPVDGASPVPPDAPGVSPGPDAPGASPGPDAAPDAGPILPMCGAAGPDACGDAMDLTAAASTAGGTLISSDTSGLSDDLRPPAAGCTTFTADGPDTIYRVTVPAGKKIRATVTPDLWDASVFIANACTSSSCVAGADAVLDGEPETVEHVATTAGTYYVVVDGWDSSAAGCYLLQVTIE